MLLMMMEKLKHLRLRVKVNPKRVKPRQKATPKILMMILIINC